MDKHYLAELTELADLAVLPELPVLAEVLEARFSKPGTRSRLKNEIPGTSLSIRKYRAKAHFSLGILPPVL